MTATVIYCFPSPLCAPQYFDYALRFVESYRNNPPRMVHDTLVVVNGGPVTPEIHCLFSSLPRLNFLLHDNSGMDIGCFQHAARECASDLAVFFGASTYFNREGWLVRMAAAFQRHGNAQYGAMGNRGAPGWRISPHIRTTGFWCAPALLRAYPKTITRPEERYPAEHGPECFTSFYSSKRIKSWEITWGRDLAQPEWGSDPNGFQRGDQSALLVGDRLCEPPYYPFPGGRRG